MKKPKYKALITNIQKFSIHDGPGIRTTVFLKGCPLCCSWCSNPETQNYNTQMLGDEIDSKYYDIEEVLRICLQDRDFYEESNGGVTISGGESLTHPIFVGELIRRLKEENVHVAIETTGFVSKEVFSSIGAQSDLFLFDIKHYDNLKHKQGTGVDNSLILANLKHGIDLGLEMLIRIPVIPSYNNSISDAKQFAILLCTFGINKVQLLPFHNFGESKYERLNMQYDFNNVSSLYPEDLKEFREVFTEHKIEAFF